MEANPWRPLTCCQPAHPSAPVPPSPAQHQQRRRGGSASHPLRAGRCGKAGIPRRGPNPRGGDIPARRPQGQAGLQPGWEIRGLGDTDAALSGHGEPGANGLRVGGGAEKAAGCPKEAALAMQHMRGTAHAAAPHCPRQPGKLVATRSAEEIPPDHRLAPRSGHEQQPPTLSPSRRCRLGPRGEAVPSCNASSGDRGGAGRDRQLQKKKKN